MSPARVAMAYQACEVADLAAAAVSLDDPAEAAAQAARVLAAAQELVAAANRLGGRGTPTDALQLFAYEHLEEAAEDVADWLSRRP
ncbi:histidinol-phosphate/aromatic aminotransferase/cobyric acid decarboxylase-like protein [Kribbella aluminosa]|uniref:Histidinol-phosphate/aromatic aminotransferase/cobyric acid decarboxylase-like protein n=1 Tax=Kribbella aluminosa TaxID=416017 RepID=A0ABS4UUA9_9ACTN|nr:hypothetical protein [Kribbella aluminosa]MBP2355234.1 histidinol-phosphate/aromatic aminotransferase/cobyric acid decarboxylase-like protein [Kribbella aluminosa]